MFNRNYSSKYLARIVELKFVRWLMLLVASRLPQRVSDQRGAFKLPFLRPRPLKRLHPRQQEGGRFRTDEDQDQIAKARHGGCDHHFAHWRFDQLISHREEGKVIFGRLGRRRTRWLGGIIFAFSPNLHLGNFCFICFLEFFLFQKHPI